MGRVAVVTGAGEPLGQAVAGLLLAEGARVVLFGGNGGALAEVAAQAPARALCVAGETTRGEDLRRLVAETLRRFGRVDVLVPVAATARREPFVEASLESMRERMTRDVCGPAETLRAFLSHLPEGGTVVFLAPFALEGTRSAAGGSSAATAAGALVALTRSLAVELRSHGLRINCVTPPAIEPGGRTAASLPTEDAPNPPAPSPSPASALWRQVAETVAFLASDAAAGIRGQALAVEIIEN